MLKTLHLRDVLLCIPLMLCLACASAGIHAPSKGEPMRISFLTYESRDRFEIANSTHTDPVELYSSKRGNSGMKIAEDSVLLEVIEYLGDHGFGEFEQGGKAPRWGTTPFTIAFEIETGSGISHWGTSKVSSNSERVAMTACWRYYFNEIYNQIQSYQTVDNQDGTYEFKSSSPFE